MPGEEKSEETYSSVGCDGLTQFTRTVFGSLPRADQRRWAEVYLRGLLKVQGRKSIRNIADAVLADTSATQSLQQFVNQSPWDWGPVRARLASSAHRLIRPTAWVIENSVIPKRGEHSVGVEPRFVQYQGRTVNSQLGISIVAADDFGCFPLNWRLHLSNRWLADQNKRARTRIPDSVEACSEMELALEMVDELTTEWGISPVPPIVTGAKPDDALTLAEGLLRRSRSFLIQVEGNVDTLLGSPSLAVQTACSFPPIRTDSLRRPDRTCQDRPQRSLVVIGSTANTRRQPQVHHVTTALLRPQSRANRNLEEASIRLIREQTVGRRTDRSWLTNLPASAIRDMTTIQRMRHYTRSAIRQFEDRFGLRDFEGRSFPGWHHHLTLVSAAALFSALGESARQSA
ncbi:IS701 family transposase [Streptosporangium sp. NPDC001559]|uniref:IS701 family transposase n=1 Tax=Streptosporangium sp. NPDC001559 TaxID=3366187 RepID=UPI0036EE666E